MQMGEHEFEWVPVTFGSMNVCNSALLFFCAVGWEQGKQGKDDAAYMACGALCVGLLSLEVVSLGFPLGIIR